MPIITGYWYFIHLAAEVNPQKIGKRKLSAESTYFFDKKNGRIIADAAVGVLRINPQ